jgi:hypothetical protein
MAITKKMDKYTEGDILGDKYGDLLLWLDIDPKSHRHVFRDLRTACIMMSLFFPTKFFESESGIEFKDSLLINQVERAKKLPDRRRFESNRCLPKEFWTEWDKLSEGGIIYSEDYPKEWNMVLRPILAHCKPFMPILSLKTRLAASELTCLCCNSVQSRNYT